MSSTSRTDASSLPLSDSATAYVITCGPGNDFYTTFGHSALRITDSARGIDYVVLPQWKLFMIQLLNIAGLGPIFGALSGAMWGPVVVAESDFNKEKKEEIENAFVKIENDPRVTKVGKFIRKYSIDELPQLFNILKGDMSIVGNRPLPLYAPRLHPL